jgi:predicted metal-dependent hydrolase
MTAITLPTPADLEIRPRDRRFDRSAMSNRLWHGGRVEATAIYNSLSTSFPDGEAYFVESVRYFRDLAPPKLADEIKAFTTQEAIHSREHDAFNRRATDAGYDLSKLEARVRQRLELSKDRWPGINLAATMGLEHFTAIFAHQILSDPSNLEGADPEAAELWRWHCVEEIEHKGVAYDTWLYVTRDWSRWKRWNIKRKLMLFVSRNFIVDRTQGALELMRQDGVTGLRAWRLLLTYMWVRPGLFRKAIIPWLKFFMPGFHPWNEDDRHLLAGYDATGTYEQTPKRKVRGAA